MRTAAVTLLMLAAASAHADTSEPERPRAPRERGVALGLFSADDDFSYRGLLEEVKEVGATHVSITWVMWQKDLRATKIERVASWTATEEQILHTMRLARALGLHVTAFPILRLVEAGPSEWRGKIAPSDEDAWWASYRAMILESARLSTLAGANRLCVGSELLSREHMRARWIDLIAEVRRTAPKLELLYSANWDHYEHVSFWDAVDVLGVTGYFELTRSLDPTVDELGAAWSPVRASLEQWSERLGRPLVFTEVGYPSLDGGASWPWDETRQAAVDLEEQRRAYEAFTRSWSSRRVLQGVYFWNWFGFGGPRDPSYTPRGKPAAGVIRGWYSR